MSKNPNEELRSNLIRRLAAELSVLRAKLGISQEELAIKIGVSRQTISSIEGKKRDMTWAMFLSLVCFFDFNDKTAGYLRLIGICSDELNNQLKVR